MSVFLFIGHALGVDHLGKCDGGQSQVADCKLAPCNDRACVDCTFGAWNAWEPCTCEGLQEHRRSVKTKNNECGSPCEGTLVDTRSCKTDCRGKPEDCRLSEWTKWSQCDKECDGGQRYRERHVTQASNHMGKPCEGKLEETQFCNMQHCYTVQPCIFAEWGQWSPCTTDCDGEKKRSRAIASPAGHGGSPCRGALEEYARCSGPNCDGSIDCRWSEWIEWSTCTKSCGGGTRARTRSIATAPFAGGKLCHPLVSSEISSCNNQLCNGQHRTDCAFEPWSAWDACSCTANGISHRVRHISVYASNDGAPCVGAAREIMSCNIAPLETSTTPAPTERPGAPVDCRVARWSSWTECSKECGPGSQVRSRHVEQYPSQNGAECAGSLEEMQGCEKAPCAVAKADEPCDEAPVDFEFGSWEEWGVCSVSCSGGERTRSRSIVRNANMYGAAAKLSATLEVEPCNSHGCNCRDCAWGVWSDWGACTCTGLKERHREIQSHADECGKPCEGARVATAACEPECAGPTLDCAFDAWSEWSTCSATCGGGERARKRDLDSEASVGGRTCDGVMKEVEACNVLECFSASPCLLADWSAWSECSIPCGGGGQQTRVRDIISEAEHNGKGCESVLKEIRGCDGQSCGGAVDCVWGEWGHFGPCSASCGDGHKTRERSIATATRLDGKLCDARSKAEVVACNASPCSDAMCVSGEWSAWDMWSQCSASCGLSYKVRNRAVAVAASSCGHPAEGPSTEYEKCQPQLCNEGAVDCLLSTWAEWGSCSCSCNGIKERTRAIAVYSKFGGRACNAPLKEVDGCNLDTCDVSSPVDCEITPWAPWSECSVSCNGGIHYRHRDISRYPEEFGKACQGSLRVVRPCNQHSCILAVDCQWGEWTEWGVCSKECGSGQHHRYRHIKQMPHHNGAPCSPKDSSVIRACNTQECTGVMKYCGFGPWGMWTTCSVTCGEGKKTRNRELQVTESAPEEVFGSGILEEVGSSFYQPSNEKLTGMFAAGALVSLVVYAGFLQMQRGCNFIRHHGNTFSAESELQLLGPENQNA